MAKQKSKPVFAFPSQAWWPYKCDGCYGFIQMMSVDEQGAHNLATSSGWWIEPGKTLCPECLGKVE